MTHSHASKTNISPQKRFFFIEVRLPGTVGGDPRQHREGQKGQEVQEGKKGEEKEGNVFLRKIIISRRFWHEKCILDVIVHSKRFKIIFRK